MSSTSFTNEINSISFYTDCLILAILISVELWVFIKLRFKVDSSGILTLLLHLLASLIRVLRSYYGALQFLIVVAGMIIWISLHYFTFEM